jgi:hypothetical protein
MNKLCFSTISSFVNAVKEKDIVIVECKSNNFQSYGKDHCCKLTVGKLYEAIVSPKDKNHFILFNDDCVLQEYSSKFFKPPQTK